MANTSQAGDWKVVTWKHSNVGGESLVFRYDPGEPFAVCTGPSPWGCGSWGVFPAAAIISVRDLRRDDSWIVSGTLRERWTARDVRRSLAFHQHYTGRTDARIPTLDTAIAAAEGER